jgi:glycosyltransferase involved in cell wall biosynthesis
MSQAAAGVLVITPTYNRANLLPEAISSVLSQDYPHVTLTVIDDGSTDNSSAVCSDMANLLPKRLVYLHQENKGCASARNRGLEELDGRFGFVCFLDSDDRLLPGKLAREVALLDRHSEAEFTYADSVIFDEASGQERIQTVAGSGQPDRFAIEHFLTNEAKCSAILYRADAVRHRRFREDLRYNEDSDFLQRVAIENRGVYSPHPGCRVRWHEGSKSRNLLEIQKAVLRSSLAILEDYPEFHAAFRAQADSRISNIRRSLFRQLMMRAQWDEANLYATTLLDKFFVAMRSNSYYRLRRQIGEIWLEFQQTSGGIQK